MSEQPDANKERVKNGLSEASKEQLKNRTGEEIVDADVKSQMNKRKEK